MTVDSLTLTARQVRRFRDHLLRDDELERAAMLYCSWSGDRLLCEEVHPVPDEEMRSQERTACRPELSVEREHFQTCVDRDMHPVLVHSHPFSRDPYFSSRDWVVMDGLHDMMTALFDDVTIGFVVVAQAGIAAGVSNRAEDCVDEIPVTVVGERTLDQPVHSEVHGGGRVDEDVSVDNARNDRTIRAVSEEGFRRLSSTHIAVVGVGGLGSIMAEQFARYDVGELTVVDPDVVEESNLNRMQGATPEDVGRSKADVVAEHVEEVNPSVTATAVGKRAEDAADVLKTADIIVGGLDQVSARVWLNRFAVRHLIEYVDAGVRIHTEDTGTVMSMNGAVQFVQPGATACYDCLNRGDREQAQIERLSEEELEREIERGYVDGSVLSPDPMVVPLNGVAASKTVQLVAAHVAGYIRPENEVADYVTFDLVGNELSEISTSPREGCVSCGADGVLGRGDREPPMDYLLEEESDEVSTFDSGVVPTAAMTGPDADIGAVPDAVAAYFDQLHSNPG